MGFFKEFKEDLLQAADELIPVGDKEEKAVEQKAGEEKLTDGKLSEKEADNAVDTAFEEDTDDTDDMIKQGTVLEEAAAPVHEAKPEQKKEAKPEHAGKAADTAVKEDKAANKDKDMEVTTISKGVHLEGNLKAEGSVNLLGSVVGDLSCEGKLVIDGTIKGNAHASEIYANGARVEGDIMSEGSLKIGAGSVVIGNIIASSAVIGGAVKGDIDVKGPVIIDATAVVYGNIKSRSVQLNSGAVLEGFVSQCYAGIDAEALFNEKAAK